MSVTEFKAIQKWGKIPKNVQKLILDNALCSECGVTTIVNYTITDDKGGLLIKGACKKCGKEVVRFVED